MIPRLVPVCILLVGCLFCSTGHAADAAPKRPTIGLALSGGGARGFAHIGVIQALEELQIPIDMIAGTSMGSVVGGLYAMGLPSQELVNMATTVDWADLFRSTADRRSLFFTQKKHSSRFLFEIGLQGFVPEIPSGLSAGEKIANLFSVLTASTPGVRNFDQLPIPFRAVATDIVTGQEVILDGSQLTLAESMRASMAVPFVFTPLELGERLLVDGGIVKNLPVDVLKNMGADIVIAVNVSAPLRSKAELQSLLAVIDQTVSLQIVQSTQQQLALANLVITPDLQELSAADFSEAQTFVTKGKEAALAMRHQLERLAGVERQTERAAAPAPPHQPSPVRPLQIEDVIIEGNVSTSDLSLLREIGLRKGETVYATDLEARLKRIYGVGFFESVQFGVEPGKRGGDIVRVRVAERTLNRLRFGFHFNEKEQGLGLAGLAIRPWPNRNALLSTEVQFGSALRLQASYLHYRLFDTGFYFEPRTFYREDFQQLFAETQQIGEYLNREAGFALMFGNTFRNFGEVTAGYQWKTVSFKPDAGERQLARFRGKVAMFSLRSHLDTLDQFPFPTLGQSVQLASDLAGKAMGGDTNFTRAHLTYRHYFSPLDKHTFSLGVQLGTSFGTDLPVSEDFVLGGPESFLGLSRDELRGAHLGVLSLGYRYRLFSLPTGLGHGAYAQLGFNTGNIWSSVGRLRDDFSVRYGGGVGLGLDTIIGPVWLTYGRGQGGRDRFYVSVGAPF